MLFSMGLMQKGKCVTGSFLAFFSQENAWETIASDFTSQFCSTCASKQRKWSGNVFAKLDHTFSLAASICLQIK